MSQEPPTQCSTAGAISAAPQPHVTGSHNELCSSVSSSAPLFRNAGTPMQLRLRRPGIEIYPVDETAPSLLPRHLSKLYG